MAKPIVEIAQIKLRSGVSEEVFIATFRLFVERFARHQQGFLKCELLKKDDGSYLDLVHWETRSDALCAFERSAEDEACLAFFDLLEVDEADPSGGVVYLTPVVSEPHMDAVS